MAHLPLWSSSGLAAPWQYVSVPLALLFSSSASPIAVLTFAWMQLISPSAREIRMVLMLRWFPPRLLGLSGCNAEPTGDSVSISHGFLGRSHDLCFLTAEGNVKQLRSCCL